MSRLPRAASLIVLTTTGVLIGMGISSPRLFGQQDSTSAIALSPGDFETPEGVVRNFYWAMKDHDIATLSSCFAEPIPLPSRDPDEVDYVWHGVKSLASFLIETRREISPSSVEIHARPIGAHWEQSMPDVFTLTQTIDGWKIASLRQYGPEYGGLGIVPSSVRPNKDLNPLVGVWVTQDENPSGLTRVEIGIEGNEFVTRVWGSCSPIDCFWGKARGDAVAGEPDRLTASYITSFSNIYMSFVRSPDDTLTCTYSTDFTDTSQRGRHENVSQLARLPVN